MPRLVLPLSLWLTVLLSACQEEPRQIEVSTETRSSTHTDRTLGVQIESKGGVEVVREPQFDPFEANLEQCDNRRTEEPGLSEISFRSADVVSVLRQLQDDALEQHFEESGHLHGSRHRQACLLEMAHRGSARWQDFLSTRLRNVQSSPDPNIRGWLRELENLIVLRRAQGKRDPLALRSTGHGPIEATSSHFPPLELILENVDEDGESFAITCGSWLRRIRVDIRDANGRPIPRPEPEVIILYRGGFHFRELTPGEQIRIKVDLNRRVHFPKPGEYQILVHYHNKDMIWLHETADGLILTSADPIIVHVRPPEAGSLAHHRRSTSDV